MSKLIVDQNMFEAVKEDVVRGHSVPHLAKLYDVSATTISRIKHAKRYEDYCLSAKRRTDALMGKAAASSEAEVPDINRASEQQIRDFFSSPDQFSAPVPAELQPSKQQRFSEVELDLMYQVNQLDEEMAQLQHAFKSLLDSSNEQSRIIQAQQAEINLGAEISRKAASASKFSLGMVCALLLLGAVYLASNK